MEATAIAGMGWLGKKREKTTKEWVQNGELGKLVKVSVSCSMGNEVTWKYLEIDDQIEETLPQLYSLVHKKVKKKVFEGEKNFFLKLD